MHNPIIIKTIYMLNSKIDNFLSHVHFQMASIMSRQFYSGVEMDTESALLEFNLPEPLPINDLLDILDDHMELVILYHVIPSGATVMGEQCCAYSDPAADFIYKVNCITGDNGTCGTIYVTLYESLETMGIDVQSELEEQTAKSHEIVFARKLTDVLRDFMR